MGSGPAVPSVSSVPPSPPSVSSLGRMVRSGAGVGATTMLAAAANYAANVLMGRRLGLEQFADAALVVSAMMLLSAVAFGFQLLVARSLAAGGRQRGLDAARRRADAAGAVIGALIAATSPGVAAVFNMGSPAPLLVLGAGVPLFFRSSIGRGVAQAAGRFGRLCLSIAAEALVRVVAVWLALVVGWGATGVSVALVVSFAAAAWPCWSIPAPQHSVVAGSGGQAASAAAILLSAQVVIGSGDIWVVASRLPDRASEYAAVALIGRLVFVASTAVVNVVFPALVRDRGTSRLLWVAAAVLALSGSVLTVGAFVVGEAVVESTMGAAYAGAGELLGPYALATTLFVVANLFAVAGVAAGRRALPSLMAVGAVVQVVVLAAGADAGIGWVVWCQVAGMSTLVAVMVTANLRHCLSRPQPCAPPAN